ncbi:MAG: WD40 repeat domain-containing protein [Planctomycetota bacterium]
MLARSVLVTALLLSLPSFAEEPEPKGRLLRMQLQNGVGDLRFSPDGKMLAVAGFDRLVHLFDTKSGQEVNTLEGHTGRVTCVAFSADSKVLATGSDDNSIRIWDLVQGRSLRSKANAHGRGTHGTGATTIGFFPDGKSIFSTGYDPLIRVWEVETLKELRRMQGHRDCVCAGLSADGKLLASASQDSTAKLWDAETGAELGAFEIQPALRAQSPHLGYPVFSPDGGRLYAGGGDGRMRTWSIPERKVGASWAVHGGFVGAVDISADGGLLVTGGMHPLGAIAAPDRTWDNAIRLWDASSGELLLELGGHTLTTCRCRLSADGTRLATGSWDGSIQVWDLTALELSAATAASDTDDALWKRLGEAPGPRSWSGVAALAAKPDRALEMFGARLRPAAPDPDFSKRVADLILRLDHDDPEIRDKAQEELVHLGPKAEAAIRKTLQSPPSAEVRMRIQEILETKLPWEPFTEDERRTVRAVRILEGIAGEKSAAILETLSSGDPESALTAMAKEALKRIKGR